MYSPWRIVAIGLLSVSAGGSAWAQATAPVSLANGKSVSAYGLTATIQNFSCTATCSGDDRLEFVSSGRGTIMFEIVNTTAGSAIFTNSTTTSKTMSLDLVITPNASYLPAGEKVSAAVLTTTGVDKATSGSPIVRASAAFAASTGAGTLTDTLVVGTGASPQTISPASKSFTTTSNSFTVTETLTINPNGALGTSLSLNLLALKLSTVPEPATGALIVVGVTGLAMVRRRRLLRPVLDHFHPDCAG
jgi:hypothetical protein